MDCRKSEIILTLAGLVGCEVSPKTPTATFVWLITRSPNTSTPRPSRTPFPTRSPKPTYTPWPSYTPTRIATVTPTPGMEIWLDEVLPVCQTAENTPIQGGQPLAPLLGVRIVAYTEYGYTFMDDHKTGVFLLPHIGAMTRAEIATLVCVYQTREGEASYTDGQPGYRIYWTVLAEMKAKGAEPPLSKTTNSHVYGGFPDKVEVLDWIVKLIPNTPENVRFTGRISSMGMAQDGTILAAAVRGDDLQIWNLTNGKRISVIKRDVGGFGNVVTAFSCDGSLLATLVLEETVNIYRVKDGRLVSSLKPDEDQYFLIDSLAFSVDGTVLAAGTWEKTIWLWNLPDSKIIRSLQGLEGHVSLISFSPDGKFMLSGVWLDGPIRLWETSAYDLHLLLTSPEVEYGAAAFSHDGNILGAITHQGALQFWRVEDGEEIGRWIINQYLSSLAFSPDGSMVATGTNEGNIKLWSYPEGRLLHEYNGHSGGIVGLIFSFDNKVLYSGSWDGTAYLWELP